MFKAKINLKNVIQWVYLIVIITSTIFSGLSNTYAGSISLDALVQKISQLGTQTSIESSSSNRGQKDLFLQVLDTKHARWNKASLQSIDITLQSIQKNAQTNWITSCNIKKSDIITILSRKPWFIEEISSKGGIPLWTIIQPSWDITLSCERFLRCNQNLIPSQWITQQKELSDCTSVVYNTYTINKNLRANQLSLPEKNNNDNIYMDGVKDNALFDLMIDITNIKNILFEKWTGPDTPTMIYYSLPKVTVPSNNNQQNNSVPWWISAFWWSSNGSTVQWSNSWWWSTNTSTWWRTGTQSSWSSNTTSNGRNNINDFMNSLKDDKKNNTDSLAALPTATIQATLCPIPWTETTDQSAIDDETTDSETTQEIIDEFYDTQNKLLDALSGFLYTPDSTEIWWLSWIPWSSNNGSSNIIKTDTALPWTTLACKTSCSQIEWSFEKMTCEGKCCLNSCNQLTNIKDRIVCLGQCTCGDKSTANDMLRIKICIVPAQSSRVLAGKKITSIEEAVIEINEIFNKLKQNGLLSKRSKKQEFMDSSFSDIKFHEVFAFDIFVAMKPIYDKLQSKQQKENTIKDNNTIKSINPFIWWNKVWGIWKDKNKYLLIGDTKSWDDWIKYCTSLWAEFSPITKKCITNTSNTDILLEKLSKTNTSSVFNDNFYKFSKEQYILREQIYKQITDIQSTANILKTKAENAQ